MRGESTADMAGAGGEREGGGWGSLSLPGESKEVVEEGGEEGLLGVASRFAP